MLSTSKNLEAIARQGLFVRLAKKFLVRYKHQKPRNAVVVERQVERRVQKQDKRLKKQKQKQKHTVRAE